MKTFRLLSGLFTSALTFAALSAGASPVVIVGAGSAWRYSADGTDQGTAWRSVSFNDAIWNMGPAQLGFGDGDEVTMLTPGIVTAYFRHAFESQLSGVSSLTLRLLRDDGAVVYINGVEVFRNNMPAGPVSYTTLATAAVGGAEESTEFIVAQIDPNALVQGVNVVAVEVHQVTVSSGDLSFDLELIAESGPSLPTVNVIATDFDAAENGVLAAIFPGTFTFSRSGSTNNALTARFTLAGSAENGVDYARITNEVRFNPGQAQARVDIVPLNDGLVEGTENVVLMLQEPLCAAVVPPPPGCYRVGPSNRAEVFIKDADRPPNQRPYVQLNEPQDGDVFITPTNIVLRAFAQDIEDGHNLSVEFLASGNTIGFGTFVPALCPSPYCPYFQLIWNIPPPGNYTLTARATDSSGASSNSTPVNIIVRAPDVGTNVTLVANGSVWKYLDNGSDQGTAWRQVDFNDSTWASGPAQLGYGDGDEATVVSFGPDPLNKYITTYFRRAFSVVNATSFSELRGNLLQDDGAVLYLNGVEVFRSNLPIGPIGYNTLAIIGAPDNVIVPFAASGNFLREGLNVVAVEMHQNSVVSSDLSFDLELIGVGEPQPPELPVVNVIATDSDAGESGPLTVVLPGTFTFYRTPVSSNVLTVSFALSGSAENGVDYIRITNTVRFTPGQAQARVDVYPLNDALVEGIENVVLTLQEPACAAIVPPPPGCYRVGPSSRAEVFIRDANTPPDPGTNVTLIASTSVWKYLDNGSDQGTVWRQVEFNDSAWASGPGQLGYGDGDEATVVSFGPDPMIKYVTTYFRRGFNVVNAASFSQLRGRLLQDDGGVVYLNGVEIFRSNLPGGPIFYNTLATGVVNDNQIVEFAAPGSLLQEGLNVVAVEMHQNAVSSTDLSFDLQLIGIGGPQPPPNQPPRVSITSPIEGETFESPASIIIQAVTTDPDGYAATVEFFANEEKIGEASIVFIQPPPPGEPIDFEFTWTNPPLGSHRLTARTVDNQGAHGESEPVNITVHPAVPVITPAPNDQEQPAVASDGTNFLVVWTDERNRHTTWYDIYGARVSANGEVLDRVGIPISTAPDMQSYPSVAFDGQNYFVVWHDRRHRPEGGPAGIYGARVSRDGVVLDPNGFQITDAGAFQASVAFNGAEYLVAAYNGNAVLGVRVSPAGEVRDTQELILYQSSFHFFSVAVASVAGEWLVSWNEWGPEAVVNGVHVSADGNVSNPVTLVQRGRTWERGLAAVGPNYFLTSTATRQLGAHTYVTDVFGTWISREGQPLRTVMVSSNRITTLGGTSMFPTTYLQDHATAAAHGSNVVVVWDAGAIQTNGGTHRLFSDIRGARVLMTGFDSPSFSICTAPQDQSHPAIAFNGQRFLAAWQDARSAQMQEYSSLGHFDIFGARIIPSGVVGETNGFLISIASTNRPPETRIIEPAEGSVFGASETIRIEVATTDFDGYASTVEFFANEEKIGETSRVFVQPPPPGVPIHFEFNWSNAPAGQHWLTARAIDDRGGSGVSEPVNITVRSTPVPPNPAPQAQEWPAVATDGENFFAVWMDWRNRESTWRDIDGARISATGEVLDPEGIPICTLPSSQLYASVAFDGNNFLVVWSDDRDDPDGYGPLEIYGARVSRSGAVLDPNGIRITQGEIAYQPTVAFNGTDYLVAAYAREHNGQRGDTLIAVRVTPAGVVLDTEELVLFGPESSIGPAMVASVGGDWLVAWNFAGFHAARVSPSGNVSPPQLIANIGPTWMRGFTAVGSNYFVTSTAYRQVSPDTYVTDVYGTWINAAGHAFKTVLVSSNLNYSTGSGSGQPTQYQQGQATAGGNGFEALVIWESGAIYTNGGNQRWTSDIRGARVTASGSVSPTFSVCSAPQDQGNPSIAFNGQQLLAVWQDARNAPPEEYSPFDAFDIFGARLTLQGAVLEHNGFLISSAASNRPPHVQINSPQTGDVFTAPASITLRAYAEPYNVAVEFFADNQSLGYGTFVPSRCATPYCPYFALEWNGVPAGVYNLRARATDQSGGSAFSEPVTITVREAPGDRELHAVGIHNGRTADGTVTQQDGHAAVVVNRPGKQVTLFLSAYWPVRWHVTFSEGTVLEKVILGGYETQMVEGIDVSVPVLRLYGGSQYLIEYNIDSVEFQQVQAKLCALTGMDMSSFHGAVEAPYPTPFVIDAVQNDPRLDCDYPQPVDPSQLPNLSFRLAFNDRNSSGVIFQDYTLAGPQNGARLLPTYRVVSDAGNRYYYGAEQHQVWRVDTQTATLQDMDLGPSVPELSWPMGVAFDGQRNRVLVVSLGGEGYLYAYSPSQAQWSLVSSMDNQDVDSLVYHAADDSIYAVTTTYNQRPYLLRFNPAGVYQSRIALPFQPFNIFFGGSFRSEVASIGDYLVLFLETDPALSYGLDQFESRMYLVDPRTGQHWLTYRKTTTGPDSDRDGVPDNRDQCSYTPSYAAVDANGCSADQRDSDHDGVPDSRDQCLDTPSGTVVDANGCPVRPCPPRIQWQASIGGSGDERLRSIQLTADGGYILGGDSHAGVGGDKSEPNYGYYDYWVVRLDANGDVLWDRTFGGDDSDDLAVVRQTADGGFILAGTARLGHGGNQGSPSFGAFDMWIIRLDANGNKLWEKSFGGAGGDSVSDVHETADGGFVLGGYSASGVSGNKSAPNYGGADAWIVRIDAGGNKLWDRSFGGTQGDLLTAMAPTADGGFVLAMGSSSGASGNKTTPNFDTRLISNDYWVVRIDADGNKLWETSFGGSGGESPYAVQITADGDILLAGYSSSGTDGNKTSPTSGNTDFWVVRADADGNKLWDRSYGGPGVESFPSFESTADGGFLLTGPVFGHDGFGALDIVVFRLDAEGNTLWQQLFGGSRQEWYSFLAPTADGGYVLGVQSDSPVGSGNRTSPHLGALDFWLVKLRPGHPDDCDSDGVPNNRDQCPETTAGIVVDSNGCSADQRDTDHDGVRDSSDLCPNTAPGAIVDSDGCSADQRDTDRDGVADSRDQCPDTEPGLMVDANGCPLPLRPSPLVGWGCNFYGEIHAPPGFSNVVALAGGLYHTLALKGDGTLLAWGLNDNAQNDIPTEARNVVAIASAWRHDLAVTRDGRVVAWGSNTDGQTDVPAGLSGVVAVAAGSSHSLALKANGTVVGWGENFFGQSSPPADLTGVIAISAGQGHSVALKSDGTVVVWGDKQYGQGDIPDDLTNVVAIASGFFDSYALKSDGTVVGWGFGWGGPHVRLSDVMAIAAGGGHLVALKRDRTVVTHGGGECDELKPQPPLTNVVLIAAGADHSLALLPEPAPPLACPCDTPWRNHSEYVSCVVRHAWQLFRAGLIAHDERRQMIRDAVQSTCGTHPDRPEPISIHLFPLTREECQRDGVQFVLSGDATGTCVIECSEDLVNWRTVESVPLTGWEITCPIEPGAKARFYRVRSDP